MKGFPNKISMHNIENKIFLNTQDTLYNDNTLNTKQSNDNIKYCLESPPKPLLLFNNSPKLANVLMKSSINEVTSPILSDSNTSKSPFARYTPKQNKCLLQTINLNDCVISPSNISPSIIDTENNNNNNNLSPETDKYGFYIDMSENLFNLSNTCNTSINNNNNPIIIWEDIINNNIPLSDISKDLLYNLNDIPFSLQSKIWKYLACKHEENKNNQDNINTDNCINHITDNNDNNDNNNILSSSTKNKIWNSDNINSDGYKEYIQWKEKGQLNNNPNATQIELDLARTFPSHKLFKKQQNIDNDNNNNNNNGQSKLQSVLLAYSCYNPQIGYCQGMSYITGLLLMYYSEAEVFWLLEWILQKDRLGTSYTKSMEGLLFHSNIFDVLLKIHYPLVYKCFKKAGIHPLMYVTSWFMTLFTQLNSWSCVLNFFNLLFYYGPEEALFRFALSIIHICQEDLLSLKTLDKLLPYLQNIPLNCCNNQLLIPLACSYPIKYYIKHAKEILNNNNNKNKNKKILTSSKLSTIPLQSSNIKNKSIKSSNIENTSNNSVSSFLDKVFGLSSTPKKISNKTSSNIKTRPKTINISQIKNQSKLKNKNDIPKQVPLPDKILNASTPK